MRTRTLDRLLFIFGILFMAVASVVFALYVKTEKWYIELLLYALIPVVFMIWWLILELTDNIIKGIKRTRDLKEKAIRESETYQIHLLETDDELEYISRHRLAKYNVMQEQKELNLDELNSDIEQTKASIEQLTKQLNELSELKEKYIWKEWNDKFLKPSKEEEK